MGTGQVGQNTNKTSPSSLHLPGWLNSSLLVGQFSQTSNSSLTHHASEAIPFLSLSSLLLPGKSGEGIWEDGAFLHVQRQLLRTKQ